MNKNLFRPAEILLPKACDMTRWSVVACDQFTSDMGYWRQVDTLTEGIPSSRHMILPEAYLETIQQADATKNINATMAEYLVNGTFETLEHSFIFVERTLPDGTLRRGLVGAVDLNGYDYHAGTTSPIRATEHTVESRLPPRVEIRKLAPLEMPHIILFFEDAADIVMQKAEAMGEACVYDFDLMCGGGHIRGTRISGQQADALAQLLDETTGANSGSISYAIGDGNHSLAAAKNCWEALRQTLSAEDQETHPARFALVELMNIHDEGVTFHPIHRAVFGIDNAAFAEAAEERLFSSDGAAVTLVTGKGCETRYVQAESIGRVIETVDTFCQEFAKANGGQVDYIHGDKEAMEFGAMSGNAAILLPGIDKSGLIPSVETTGVFCKKSFSIGEAPEKRYYLECRSIQK